MNRGEVLLYVVLPYAAIAVFLVGHYWRYRTDQLGWGARSSQILESRALKYGSTIFHLGVLAAIGGHVLGVLIPASWTSAVGISDDAYHVIAVIGGLSAGGAVCVGFAILVYRRIRFPRVRMMTTRLDVATFALLAIGIVTGMLATITNFGDAVHYRESVAPYFREMLVLDPNPGLMTGEHVSFIFQLHVTSVWFLYALWPFSRLVHVWSIPVDWFRRSPVPYRPRVPVGRTAARSGQEL
ncbi:MAG TPA: respiratory nitrate reductase subunit gamma [Solirubrobacterales bacterium]|nr:respiratory nitrate reductase subunit gamma [Solirubrobacterales bacterium]